jgi:YD repeat-containing protein
MKFRHSPVILKTLQLIYPYKGLNLWGKIPLEIGFTYLSCDPFVGIFGNHRRSRYEQQFLPIDNKLFRLYLSDGRFFDFTYHEGSFIDEGGLGVEITVIDIDTYTLYYYKELFYEYYHLGVLKSIQDNATHTLTIHRDRRGRTRRIENSEGSKITFTYNKDHLVNSLSDHTGRRYDFCYDEHKNLIFLSDPKGMSFSYSYLQQNDSEGQRHYLLERGEDQHGICIFEASYDEHHRVSGYRDAQMHYHYTCLSYNMIEKCDNMGSTINYELDSNGYIKAITYPNNTKEKQRFDSITRVLSKTDEGGNTSYQSFDQYYKLIEEIDHRGRRSYYTYEGKNPYPISILNGDKETRMRYDERYNLTDVFLNNGSSCHYQYDISNNLITFIDVLGHTYRYEYDTLQRLSKMIVANDHTYTYEYDTLSRNIRIIDPMQKIWQCHYDLKDELAQLISPKGSMLSFTYDNSGKLLSMTKPDGNSTYYRYDHYGNMIQVFHNNTCKSTYTYNLDSTLSRIVHEEKKVIELRYDRDKRLIETHINGKSIKASEKTLEISDDLKIPPYTYDPYARVIRSIFNEHGISKHYDEHGISIYKHIAQSIRYERESAGLITILRTPYEILRLKYDSNGILYYPNVLDEIFNYDEAHRLTHLSSDIRYKHDSTGIIHSKHRHRYSYSNDRSLMRSTRRTTLYDRSEKEDISQQHHHYEKRKLSII